MDYRHRRGRGRGRQTPSSSSPSSSRSVHGLEKHQHQQQQSPSQDSLEGQRRFYRERIGRHTLLKQRQDQVELLEHLKRRIQAYDGSVDARGTASQEANEILFLLRMLTQSITTNNCVDQLSLSSYELGADFSLQRKDFKQWFVCVNKLVLEQYPQLLLQCCCPSSSNSLRTSSNTNTNTKTEEDVDDAGRKEDAQRWRRCWDEQSGLFLLFFGCNADSDNDTFEMSHFLTTLPPEQLEGARLNFALRVCNALVLGNYQIFFSHHYSKLATSNEKAIMETCFDTVRKKALFAMSKSYFSVPSNFAISALGFQSFPEMSKFIATACRPPPPPPPSPDSTDGQVSSVGVTPKILNVTEETVQFRHLPTPQRKL